MKRVFYFVLIHFLYLVKCDRLRSTPPSPVDLFLDCPLVHTGVALYVTGWLKKCICKKAFAKHANEIKDNELTFDNLDLEAIQIYLYCAGLAYKTEETNQGHDQLQIICTFISKNMKANDQIMIYFKSSVSLSPGWDFLLLNLYSYSCLPYWNQDTNGFSQNHAKYPIQGSSCDEV